MRSFVSGCPSLILAVFLCVALVGCKDKPKTPVPSTPKAVAAEVGRIISEAEFAVQMKDFARAETLMNQAIALEKDDARHYMRLAYVAIQQANKTNARAAYEKALKCYIQESKGDGGNPAIILDIINVHLLLRQPAEAQKVLDAAVKQFPKVEDFKIMQKENAIQQMMKDPEIQSLSV